MNCIAIILSGGTGSRMNMDIPKQYIEVADRMIITESIRPFMECELVRDIRIVADEMWHGRILGEFDLRMADLVMDQGMHDGMYKFSGFSVPGANRQLSILNALRDIVDDCNEEDIVIIHDAARPMVSTDMIQRCIVSCEGHDGVMPVLPMKDTVYYSEDGMAVSKLLNRDKIFAGQAPEVFRFQKYLEACEALLPDRILEIRGSTEPAIMAGMDIAMIPGEEGNFKITTIDDLARYREMILQDM